MSEKHQSAIPGFYRMTLAERQAIARAWAALDEADVQSLSDSGLSLSEADLMIENSHRSFQFALRHRYQFSHQRT